MFDAGSTVEVVEDSVVEEILEENGSLSESEPSGSEFEASDASNSFIEDSQDEELRLPRRSKLINDELAEEGFDDEEVMLDAAIQESLQTARQEHDVALGVASSGAGSSKSKTPRNNAASLRAAAAERRVALARNGAPDVDDFSPDSDATSESSLSDSEDEPLSSIAKGKKKTNNKRHKNVSFAKTQKQLRLEGKAKRSQEMDL